MPIITSWAVLLCGILFLALTRQVILARQSQGISIGDGGDKLVLRRMRGQANAAEQMPITLIALMCVELMGANPMLLAIWAGIFVIGRYMHGITFGWLTFSPMRLYGTIASLTGTGLIIVHLGYLLILNGMSF